MTTASPPIPFRTRRRFTRRRIAIAATSLFLLGLIGLNTIAYTQARSMTHFVAGGARTAPPEKLAMRGKIGVLFPGVNLPRPENSATPDSIALPYEPVRFGG